MRRGEPLKISTLEGRLIYSLKDGFFHPIKVVEMKIDVPMRVPPIDKMDISMTIDWGRYGYDKPRAFWATVTS